MKRKYDRNRLGVEFGYDATFMRGYTIEKHRVVVVRRQQVKDGTGAREETEGTHLEKEDDVSKILASQRKRWQGNQRRRKAGSNQQAGA